jgi:outer membrane protein OmpA-like peptidoglycan-associated protein
MMGGMGLGSLLSLVLVAVTPKEYTDDFGKKVTLPLGDLSFADEVVSFEPGKPGPAPANAEGKAALGPPDYSRKNRNAGYLTLGCGGQVVFRFADNAVVDVAGPDLWVFELGPSLEATTLELSADGKQWKEVGKISGGTAVVDIAAAVKPGEVFPYVRLTDRTTACGGRWPGADIDAVAAIGSALQISLKSSVLFDTGKAILKPEAEAELARAIAILEGQAGSRIVVSGHTDSVGSRPANLKLSRARADAVRAYLTGKGGLPAAAIQTEGWAADRPAASNDTDEGRERNRRVEITVLPKR